MPNLDDHKPNPPRVDNVERYWNHPPPDQSPRCAFWLRRIAAGWRPNKRWRELGYYDSAQRFGVYIWEWSNVIGPCLYPESFPSAPCER